MMYGNAWDSPIYPVYVSPNSKQPFSRAKDRKQFCYRSERLFRRFPTALSLTKSLKTLHYQMYDCGFGLIGPCQVHAVQSILC